MRETQNNLSHRCLDVPDIFKQLQQLQLILFQTLKFTFCVEISFMMSIIWRSQTKQIKNQVQLVQPVVFVHVVLNVKCTDFLPSLNVFKMLFCLFADRISQNELDILHRVTICAKLHCMHSTMVYHSDQILGRFDLTL
ncbi:Hypothetical_protein [Hexamita inflata]|uniref:Hypothetical_protein n=1 Tax=Hexamita inflata TaxID=28002 RepID=A0AA86P923_9EUKA|nr:Hypothetical protein HINF_LOCUS22039 [Hexamita inflata]